uniref:Niban apoptosis regulator 1a n=1 Tax=Takifugu rubripes TaxID=31033 RepID=H2RXH4_TAKRU
FSVARFLQVEDDLEQREQKITQLLLQKVPGPRQDAEVLYEENLLFFDETRKWRDRYVVVRANHCLECHDSLEAFLKGVPPRQKLLPTGGTALTTEDTYMAMVDRCFPDDSGVKEDFAPPPSGMPGQFPVYLRLPYRRDSYFCFKQEAKRNHFLSILSDCIRHQNQDFLKKKTCEVQAFLKAIQLYRQDRGHYEPWDMLIGSDVRVMGNLVMEKLLPSLEKDLLPRLKAKRTEKKRVWFATVEAAYILAQEHLLEGLSLLKEECRVTARQQEVQIHSDMDQILESRRQLEEKVGAMVTGPTEKLCSESVQPYLNAVLEELMEPISSGFQEGRELIETLMDQVCQSAQRGDTEELLSNMAKPNLLSCYQKISSMEKNQRNLQDTFGLSSLTGLIHSTQIDLEQLMENAAFTFEQLLYRTFQDDPEHASAATEKAKHRVLKQYDYDSSTVRKKISNEALVSITLPFIKQKLAPTYKSNLEQFIDADYTNFIHVQNVYENILLRTLDKEVAKGEVKEASSPEEYHLFTDRESVSQSNHSSLNSVASSVPHSLLSTSQQDITSVQSVTIIPEMEPPKQVETPTSTDTADQQAAEPALESVIQQEVALAQEVEKLVVVQQESSGDPTGRAVVPTGSTWRPNRKWLRLSRKQWRPNRKWLWSSRKSGDPTGQWLWSSRKQWRSNRSGLGSNRSSGDPTGSAVVQQESVEGDPTVSGCCAQQEAVEIQQEVAVVQQEAVETQQEVAAPQQEAVETQQEVAVFQQEAVESQQEVAVVQQEAVETQQEVAAAQQEAVETQQEVAAPQQEVVETQQEVAVVQQEAVESQQEVAVVQQEAVETQQEVAAPQQEVVETQQEMAVVQQEVVEVAAVQEEVHHAEEESPKEAEPVHDGSVTKDVVSPACVNEAMKASAGGSEHQSSAHNSEETNHKKQITEEDRTSRGRWCRLRRTPPPPRGAPRLSTEGTESGPEAPPLDSIKEIRDLVVEVIEVEELVGVQQD